MFRIGRLLCTLVLLCVALPPRAHATFHFISISEVGATFLGDTNIQFVELRLDVAGQTNLTNTRLTAFDKDGIPTVLLLTPNGVGNGTTGRNVLYATAEFQTATGIAPDFVIPPGVVSPKGMICWGAPGSSAPLDPMSWDLSKPNQYVDCVAFGSFAGITRPASGTPSSLALGDGLTSLTRVKNSSTGGSNDTDFVLAAPQPCNNANQCAGFAPTPTATPTPAPPPSKAQRGCRRGIIKATNKFAGAYIQALVGCEANRLKGKVPGPCPDAKAAGKIAAADTTRTKAIIRACGTLTPADGGFGATCPGYTGSCTDPTATLVDVSSCLDCAARRAGGELIDSVYTTAPDQGILKCQLALGKAVTSYSRAVATLLARCEDGVARGKIFGACPDAKTATKIAAKDTKLRSTLCTACGGADKRCGGGDDPTPSALGVTSCPTRTVPDGASCGAIAIGTLADVVTCVGCLADFESRCTTALAAHPEALPAPCNPAP